MMYTCIQRGDGLAVSLDHMKSHLRIEDSNEDIFLEKIIRVATDAVENFLGRSLLLKTWQCMYQAKEHENMCTILLAYPPLVSIVSVCEILPSNQKREIKRYLLAPHTHHPRLSVYGSSIEVTYTCGFGGNYLAIPEPLRQSITLIAAEMFEKRVECTALLSPAVLFFLQPYRVMPCL